jgi:hypothetical protein
LRRCYFIAVARMVLSIGRLVRHKINVPKGLCEESFHSEARATNNDYKYKVVERSRNDLTIPYTAT